MDGSCLYKMLITTITKKKCKIKFEKKKIEVRRSGRRGMRGKLSRSDLYFESSKRHRADFCSRIADRITRGAENSVTTDAAAFVSVALSLLTIGSPV